MNRETRCKIIRQCSAIASAVIVFVGVARGATISAEDLKQRAYERRAVEAAIWGIPLVNVDAMRQAAGM